MNVAKEIEKIITDLSAQVENLADDDDAIWLYKLLIKKFTLGIDEKIKALVSKIKKEQKND